MTRTPHKPCPTTTVVNCGVGAASSAAALPCTARLCNACAPRPKATAAAAAAAVGMDSNGEPSAWSLVLIDGCFCFLMQAGFISLEVGQGRTKNVRNIIFKNVLDILLCALSWWLVGYGFAYGTSAGGVIGTSHFAYDASEPIPTDSGGATAKPWFFSFTFALSTVTVVSGCLAERTNLIAYPIMTTVVTSLVFSVVSHWVWSTGGWLQTVRPECGYLDFAGGTAVHAVGGLTGLIGAVLCGPRIGRFSDGYPVDIPGHDMTSYSIGTLTLWFGWLGFNCGSTYLYANPTAAAANRVALNMMLSASCAGLTALLANSVKTRTYDLRTICNGVLTGLVASSGFAGFVVPWAACIGGSLAGILYSVNSRLLIMMGVDDPLDSSVVHFGSGAFGVLLTGFLGKPEYIQVMTGNACGGVVYNTNGGLQLGLQVLGLTVISAYTVVIAVGIFLPLKLLGVLRVSQATELAGIDNMEHGGPAYPEFTHGGGESYCPA